MRLSFNSLFNRFMSSLSVHRTKASKTLNLYHKKDLQRYLNWDIKIAIMFGQAGCHYYKLSGFSPIVNQIQTNGQWPRSLKWIIFKSSMHVCYSNFDSVYGNDAIKPYSLNCFFKQRILSTITKRTMPTFRIKVTKRKLELSIKILEYSELHLWISKWALIQTK